MKNMEIDDPRPYAHIATQAMNDGDADTPHSDFVRTLAVAFWNHGKRLDEEDIDYSREEALGVLESVDLGWEADFTSM